MESLHLCVKGKFEFVLFSVKPDWLIYNHALSFWMFSISQVTILIYRIIGAPQRTPEIYTTNIMINIYMQSLP